MARPATLDFTYTGSPAQVRFGVGAAEPDELAGHFSGLGARRVMTVASAGRAELLEQLTAAMAGIVVERFSQVIRHVPVENAVAGREAARRCGADALLCLGGGSATGTAKAIALELELPIVAIPTTYAGSEVTPVWGLTEDGHKRTGRDPRVLPAVVVYDPELTLDLPLGLSISSGMNALAHCLEAIWAPGGDPISSLLAGEGAACLSSGLSTIARRADDLEGRSLALYGAWLAGMAFAATGSGLHHKICHALGGAYDLPHAELHAIVLPHATALAAGRREGADRRIADALDAPELTAAEAVSALSRRLGAPQSLAEIGFDGSELGAAAVIVEQALAGLPTPVTHSEIARLLDDAFTG